MQKYVPLRQRSADQIRSQAELYAEMAATARTPEAKRGLEGLAVRFAMLADQREAEESRAAQGTRTVGEFREDNFPELSRT